jgi:acetyltransferase-like isoleucine patch superfamily enzyme
MRSQGNFLITIQRLIRGLIKGKQFCFIGKNVNIGKNVQISPMVLIDDEVTIGNRTFIGYGCVIRPYTIIGEDCSFGHSTIIEGCTIGNRVSVHAQCHLTKDTVIENDVFMGALCWTSNTKKIDHGRKLYPATHGPVFKRACGIGSGCGFLPGVIIGENSIIGAGSVVTKNVPPREIWIGFPAKKKSDVKEGIL